MWKRQGNLKEKVEVERYFIIVTYGLMPFFFATVRYFCFFGPASVHLFLLITYFSSLICIFLEELVKILMIRFQP